MTTIANLKILLSAALVGLITLAALPAHAQEEDGAESVDSAGGKIQIRPNRGTISPSFAGLGRILRPAEKDDARATPRSRLEREEDERRLRRAKPIRQSGGSAESIIGNDTRTRVTPTTGRPARSTVLVLFSDAGSDFICSGWLINKNTVATAGHCVAPGDGTGFYAVSTYRIFPGRNGSSQPYGSCGARKLYSVGNWINSRRDDFDFGAIKLDCDIGTTTGWYGYVADDGPVGTDIDIQGYPGDKAFGQQWKARGKVTLQQARRTFYKNDTIGGMSGSPVWFDKGVGCHTCAIAIHAYGTGGNGAYANNNHGTRINQQVFDKLTAWRQAP